MRQVVAGAGVVVLLPLAGVVGESAATAATPRYAVTASAADATVVQGTQRIVIKGRVSPKAAGSKVRLQEYVGKYCGGWKTIARTELTGRSRYTFDRPSGPSIGTRVFRVVKPAAADGSPKRGISKRVVVEITPRPLVSYLASTGC